MVNLIWGAKLYHFDKMAKSILKKIFFLLGGVFIVLIFRCIVNYLLVIDDVLFSNIHMEIANITLSILIDSSIFVCRKP